MKRYVVGQNAKAYHLIGNGDNRRFVASEGVFMAEGRTFLGQLVFIPIESGLQPMVKVLDPKITKAYYYLPSTVQAISGQITFHGKPRAGEMGGKGFGVEAGVIKGDARTAPQVGELATGFSGGIYSSRYFPNFIPYSHANPSVLSELTDYSQGYPQYSSVEGSNFLGNLFGKNKGNKEELTEDEMAQLHRSSGSKMSFGDWLKSEQAANLANNALALGLALVDKDKNQGGSGNQSGSTSPKTTGNNTGTSSNSKENKILGMHPLTFGVVTVGVLVAGAVTIILLKSKKK